jgi:hypothetical protein
MKDSTILSASPMEHVYAHTWVDGEPATAVEPSWTESINGYLALAGSGLASIGLLWSEPANNAHTHIR